MGLVFWSMGAISPRLYTVPFQQEPAIGQWSLVMLGAPPWSVLLLLLPMLVALPCNTDLLQKITL